MGGVSGLGWCLGFGEDWFYFNMAEMQWLGLLCRETLISLAQAVYSPERHRTLDGIAPSSTDAKRLLEAYIAVEIGGQANDEARSHAKASLKLALALQHNRTANFSSLS